MAETDLVSYWIVIGGKNFKTGEPIETKRYGPYASEEEAEQAGLEVLLKMVRTMCITFTSKRTLILRHAESTTLQFRDFATPLPVDGTAAENAGSCVPEINSP